MCKIWRFWLVLVLFVSLQEVEGQEYTFRKYNHVKSFYKGIAKEATKICLDNNIPPAAVLAIAGLESGWGNGYVGKITGNILSLGAKKSDTELPGLYLPTVKMTTKVLFDSLEIVQYKASQLRWKQRPKSLKKDYRPKPIRGTHYQLAYFKYHPKEQNKAHLENITDFATTFVGRNSSIPAYREARKKMDALVAKKGKEILLKKETAITFVHAIGGKNNSFNWRKTWPEKVLLIMSKAGLEQLTSDLQRGKTFTESW